MREMLPVFAAARRNGDDDVNEPCYENNFSNNCRIDMLLEARGVSSLNYMVKHCWQDYAIYLQDEQGQKLLTQPYKFPPVVFSITLHPKLTNAVVMLYDKLCLPSPSDLSCQHADDAWTDAFFAQVIFSTIRELLGDAVESCARQDLSFYLYRSLKSVVYHNYLSLECLPHDESRTAEQRRERFLTHVDLLLKGQIAATFQQRIKHEAVTEFLLKHAEAATRLGWAKFSSSENDAAASLSLTALRMPTFSAVVSLAGSKKFQTILL